MNWILLAILGASASAMVAPAIWRKDYRLQFPCLAGCAVIFQVVLPLVALNCQAEEVSSESLTRFSVMAILCLAAAAAGYAWLQPPSGSKVFQLEPRRTAISAAVLTAFGLAFCLAYGRIEVDYDSQTGGMTGPGTILLTLAMVMRYGFLLAAILYFRTKNWKLVPLMLPQLWIYYGLFMIGRRTPTGEILIITCMLLFFYRKWSIPLWLLGTGMVLMGVFTLTIGEIRKTVDDPLEERVQSYLGSNPLDALTLRGMTERRSYVELFNASKFMEAKAQGGHYTCGLHFWNQLVFGFVPAQIVGREVKESLKISLADDTTLIGFEKSTGTCESGIAEAFMAFGFFGCALFFGLGAFMRWLWEWAVRGSVLHQFLAMLCMVPAVMCFTIQLWTFVNMLVNIAIFAGPFLWWSRVHNGQRAPVPARLGSRLRSARRTRKACPRWAAITRLSVNRPAAALKETETQ